MGKRQVAELENVLEGVQGGIALYRRGISENLIPDGFAIAREKLEAAQRDLEVLGLYERCRDALVRAEELMKRGSVHDHDAEMLILDANRALMEAAGSREATRGTTLDRRALPRRPKPHLDRREIRPEDLSDEC